VPINAVLCSNNGDALRAAALAGRGVADLPTFLVGPDIAAGLLRTVLARLHQLVLIAAIFAASFERKPLLLLMRAAWKRL
ncbi:MAG: hypothetical protein JOZ61_06915, partial [Verrucomicrobia bacterium]|nr:hypothetical protein [Verrucomicrobiota bacterium]